MLDLEERLVEIAKTFASIENVIDVESKKHEIADLEKIASDPTLWDNRDNAQAVTRKLSFLQNELAQCIALKQRIDDVHVLFELSKSEGDEMSLHDVSEEIAQIEVIVKDLRIKTLLNGKFDEREAVVSIRSGAGGVDAADWTQLVMRMYLRYCERKKMSVDVYDISYAEEAGLKSATFHVKAPFAYGILSIEQGTHRLVRISPFDSQSRRHTSFCEVEILPVVEQADHIDILDDEIRVDVYRASGPGGQSVNTTDSAVRITHLTTGIVVTCQNERSQLQNKVSALSILKSKLLEKKRMEDQAQIDSLKEDSFGSWGNQMRSYVMHPYQMVKDLRTLYEVGNVEAVLDGDLEGFIEAGILWRRSLHKQ